VSDARNAALSRNALVVAAGGSMVGATQWAPELEGNLWGQAILVAGAVVITLGLVGAVRALMRKPGGEDQ
jgi:hypothetical protein